MPARTPEECDALFATNLNSGNLEGMLALYEANASFVQQDGPPARGTAAIRERLAAFVAIHPKITMNIAKVIQVGDDLAVLYNDWNLTAKGPDGNAIAMNSKAIKVVRRQRNGTWMFAVDDPFGRA